MGSLAVSGVVPMVPLPPMGIFPNRRNGTDRVTMFGVMSRMTITSEGLVGMRVDDMVFCLLVMAMRAVVDTRRTAMRRFRVMSSLELCGINDAVMQAGVGGWDMSKRGFVRLGSCCCNESRL